MLVESTLPTLPTSGAILHDCACCVLLHGSYLGPHCVVASLLLLPGTEDLSAKSVNGLINLYGAWDLPARSSEMALAGYARKFVFLGELGSI